jgi:branched-chain amino acid transport system substrate-binding protein
MKYLLRLLVLRVAIGTCAATLSVSVWAQVSAPAAKPVRVGFICPFTGGSQDFGNSARLGAELAVKEINEVGGFLGRPIELVERDDKANPDEGRKVAEELVLKEKVAFTIGYCNSGVALKSLDLFQDNKHLLIVPVATNSTITTKYPPDKSYIFRMSPNDHLQAGLLVDDIVKRGFTRVAVLADKTGYGEGGLKDVLGFLADKGQKPVYVGRFDLGVSSLVSEVQQAKAAGAEVIVGYTVGPEFAVMAQSRDEAKFAGPLYGSWLLSFRSVFEKAGSAVEGGIMPQSIIQDLSNERRSSFIARLKHSADKEPVSSLMAAAQSYDAVQLMLRVMFQTKGDMSAGALKAALEKLDHPYAGVVTTHDQPFSATDHEAFTRNMIWLGVWRKGEVHFQYPEDAKRASIIRRKEQSSVPR